jgi:hypothetical protein
LEELEAAFRSCFEEETGHSGVTEKDEARSDIAPPPPVETMVFVRRRRQEAQP